MEATLVIASIVILLWLNIKATLVIRRDVLLSAVQRLSQIGIVWLFPLLGPILILAIHRPDMRTSGKYPEEREPLEDFGTSGAKLRNVNEVLDGD